MLLSVTLLTPACAQKQENLIFAIDLIRHGDRTSLHELPKAPHEWIQGKGQLTAEGMQQEFKLGTLLRKKYVEQYNLLPLNYIAKAMYVRSTDFDRTLMSAESLLMGLYPLGTGPKTDTATNSALPELYQPIPIHTIPKNLDTVFLSVIDIHSSEILQKYILTRKDWIEKTNAIQNKLPIWQQETGVPLNNLFDVSKLADTLFVFQTHHIAFPNELNPQDAKEIIETGRWAFATMFKAPEVGKLMGHALLEEILSQLEKATHNNQELKFVLLSGHDSNILALLSALEAPLDMPPRYASNLNFSLFEAGHGNYYIKINFNQEPVNIPACHGTVCSLEQLKSLLN